MPNLPVPNSVKESLWQKTLDFCIDFAKDQGKDALVQKLESWKADRASVRELNQALHRATQRFQEEHKNKSLVRALTVDTTLHDLPSVQNAVRAMLVSPFSSGMEDALITAFQQVLPKEDPIRLREAAAFLLDLINQELSGIAKVQELQQLLRQDQIAEAVEAMARQTGALPPKSIEAVRATYLGYLIECYINDDPRGIHHMDGKVSTLPLKSVFVALDVERVQETPVLDLALLKEGSRPLRERMTVTERIDLPRALREHPRLVLLGAPGAGKTTITKYVSGKIAEAIRDGAATVKDEDGNDYGPPLLPIRFRIAEFADALRDEPTLNLREYLPRTVGNCPRTPAELQTLLFDALDSGHALVIMDGLDEIVAGELRSKVAEEIQGFIAGLHQQTRVLLTSRIAGYREGARLGGSIAEFTLSKLSRPQIKQFLAKRCLAYEEMVNQNRPDKDKLSTKKIQQQADEEQGAILRAVDDPKNPGVRLLSGVPLLLTILALIHRNGKHLPNRRIELYDLAVKTLLREWRMGQGVEEKHTVKESEAVRLLGPLATHLHETTSTGRIKKEVLRRFLCKERAGWHKTEEDHPDNEAAIDDFLRRVEQHTGLLVEFGQDEYGFLHLTFEEYFAARDLLREKMNPHQRIYQKRHMSRWVEPIRLAISYKSKDDPEFAGTLIEDVILGRGEGFAPSWGESFLHRDVMLAGYCLADCEQPDPPLVQEIGSELLNLISDDRFYSIQATASEVLVTFAVHDLERITTALVEQIQKGGYRNRYTISALGRLGVVRDDVVQALTEQVQKGTVDSSTAASALRQLGVVREDVIQSLIMQVQKGDSASREATSALGQLGFVREDVIQALIKQSWEGESIASGYAAMALGQLGVVREDVIQALIGRVKRGGFASGYAASVFGRLGVVREDVVQALVEQAQKGESSSQTAALALGRLGVVQEDVVHVLIEQVKNCDSNSFNAAITLQELDVVRENITQALIEQVQKGGPTSGYAAMMLAHFGIVREDVIQVLIKEVQKGDNASYHAAPVLGRLGVVRNDVIQAIVGQARNAVRNSGYAIYGLMDLVEKATNENIPLPILN